MEDVVKARRDEAVQFMERIKRATDENLQYQGLKDADRERLCAIPNAIFYAFEELTERFIEPHAVDNRSLTSYGYNLLLILMANTFSAGGCLIDTGYNELEFFKQKLDREQLCARSSKGGKAERKTVPPEWAAEALPIAKDLMTQYPNSRPADLLRRLRKKITVDRTDRAVLNQFSRWEVAGEITFPKNS